MEMKALGIVFLGFLASPATCMACQLYSLAHEYKAHHGNVLGAGYNECSPNDAGQKALKTAEVSSTDVFIHKAGLLQMTAQSEPAHEAQTRRKRLLLLEHTWILPRHAVSMYAQVKGVAPF